MIKSTCKRFPALLVGVFAMFCLFLGAEAQAIPLPGAPKLTDRLNVAPYAGVLRTNSQGLKGSEFATGFTVEATVFTDIKTVFAPRELGAGAAYLATGSRVQIQDLAWLSAYWWWCENLDLL